MKDPRPLVQRVYEMQVEHGGLIDICSSRFRLNPQFDWLMIRCTTNTSTTTTTSRMRGRRDTPDTTLVYFPSRLYNFHWIQEDVALGEHKEHGAEIPECAMFIIWPDKMVTKSLLSKCRTISEHQAVIDFQMKHVHCGDATEAEAPILSRNNRSLHIYSCNLSTNVLALSISGYNGKGFSMKTYRISQVDLLQSYLPKIGDANCRCALWTFKQWLALNMRACCGISIVL